MDFMESAEVFLVARSTHFRKNVESSAGGATCAGRGVDSSDRHAGAYYKHEHRVTCTVNKYTPSRSCCRLALRSVKMCPTDRC